MAGLGVDSTKSSRLRLFIGRMIPVVAIVTTLGLGYYAINLLDIRPRTQDAFLYADRTGLAPDVSGRIVGLPIHDNQYVAKGDLLIEIDPEPFDLKLRQALAQVTTLKAQVNLTKRQIKSQSSGADAAKTLIEKAKSQRDLARDTLRRLLPLQGKGYVTDQQVDEARTNEQTSLTALNTAIQQARQAREAVGDVESLLAQIEGAEAAVAFAKRDLRNTKIYAPFDGLVAGLDIAEGEYASVGHPIFTLIKAHEWYAIGNFRETELPHIAVGDAAIVWLMSDNNRSIRGHVESIGRGVKPDNGSGPALPAVERTLSWVRVAQRFPVKVRLDAPPESLMRIGVTAAIQIHHVTAH